ncbi:MAG TPA: glycoside hydrolase family 13 protein [Negativicutes bacterium]|nr:glycoside hydrolase family 13 protein [Negativicutes bacterium]
MDIYVYHNSHEEKYRFPFGAAPCGSRLYLGLTMRGERPASLAELIFSTEGSGEKRVALNLQEKQGETCYYSVNINLPQQPELLWYYFLLVIDGRKYYYGNNERSLGGIGRVYDTLPPKYQITVFREGANSPGWYKKSIMYQIFVDRFRNGNEDGRPSSKKKNSFIYANWEDTPTYIKDCGTGGISRWDFYGGNLKGVIEKLEYLRELGVSVLYLNPIFEAPSNHKYDTADYMKTDPMFGSSETFMELCIRARQLGISVMLDGVFSHTGSDSVYFNKYGNYPGVGAYQSGSSLYYSWYRFKSSRDDYECWWGVDSLPNVNEMDPGYTDFIITGQDSVIKHWMELGARGWRLDVADELPDEFIRLIRKAMKDKAPEAVLMGEVWEDASNKISYGRRREYLLGEELDSVMNYPFRAIMLDFFTGKHDANYVYDMLMSIYENYPLHNFYSNMNLIGSHDVPRILTLLGEAPEEQWMSQQQKENYRLPAEQRALAAARLKLLVLIQMTFPGVPSIYYGDEAGLEGYRDPLNRGTYPWGREDKELLEWYRNMASIRNRHGIFSTGKWIPVYSSGDVYGFLRKVENSRDVFGEECEDNTALVLVNRSRTSACSVSIDIGRWHKGLMYDLLSVGDTVEFADGKAVIEIEPLQGKLYIKKT